MMYVYAIRDNVADNFSIPIFSESDDEMKRNISFSLRNGESMYKTYAEDYDLYRVGTFDEQDGTLQHMQHTLVAHFSSLVKE